MYSTDRSSLSLDITSTECFWTRSRSRRRGGRTYDGSEMEQEEIKLWVRDPMTHVKNGKALFTDYKIEIKVIGSLFALSYSTVRRRYSEFVWLNDKFKVEMPNKFIPSLPSTRLLGRFAVDFILSRQQGLEEYLKRLLDDDELLGNAHLHLFLQTDFTSSEIESILHRKDREDVNHIIILATTNQREEHFQSNRRHRSISDSALESSYSSLDISDVTPAMTSEVYSSGYYGDDEVPDKLSDQSGDAPDSSVVQSMLDAECFFSSSSDFDLSIEEFFEFDDKSVKKKKKSQRLPRHVALTHSMPGVFEYLMPISECQSETYVVLANVRRARPRRETNEERLKKLVNEYEVVSLL